MHANLLRLREPAAVVLLVVLALRITLAVADFAVLRSGFGLGVALGSFAFTVTDALTVVVLVAVVGTCVVWSPTAHARALTRASLGVAGLSVLLALVAVVAWLVVVGGTGESFGNLTQLVLALPVPALALVALSRLLLVKPDTAGVPQAVTAVTDGADEASPAAIEARPDPEHQPTWPVDEAAGAAWLTAGDAAAGASASRWGAPGDPGGWQPQPGQPRPQVGQSPSERPHGRGDQPSTSEQRPPH